MLEDQGYSNTTANTADDPTNYNSSQAETDIRRISDATDTSYITSLLAPAFNIIGNHPDAKEAVASDLMALNQYWWLYHRSVLVLLIYYTYGLLSCTPSYNFYASILVILPSCSASSYQLTNLVRLLYNLVNRGSVLQNILHCNITRHYFMSTYKMLSLILPQ